MNKDIKALCKIAVKLDRVYDRIHPLHKKKQLRTIKRAMMQERKLYRAVANSLGTLNRDVINNKIQEYLRITFSNMENRVGRRIQIRG